METDRLIRQVGVVRRGRGTLGAMILVLSAFATTHAAVAQDCSISNRRGNSDDIQRFRGCLEECGLDAWTVTARTAGQRVLIDMESDDVDAYLRVLRRDSAVIATDDDGGSGSNARVEFRAPHAGKYLVIATSYEVGEVGGHRVGMSDGVEIAVDDDGGSGQNARVTFRVPAAGRYTVLATSAEAKETGGYVVWVEGGGIK